MHSKKWQVLAFILLLSLAAVSYAPGLAGGFLFDDYPNLDDLGNYGGVNGWESFRNFVSNGFSGPTGRPLALASFLLDDNAWPSDPANFKRTNLLIHLLCGVLIYACIRKLLLFYGARNQYIEWIALLSSGIWLLHPHLVSTTLYIVQRMAQLSTFFVMLGLLGYLVGRCSLERSPKKAYILMTAAIVLCTVAATLSKENGALLPIFILIIEFCKPTTSQHKKINRYWSGFFLWLPTILIVTYLASKIDFSNTQWSNRNFSQVERLLTESRVLWQYIYDLWIPKIEGQGLFQDGYVVSKSLFNPRITVFAVSAWVVVCAGAVVVRRRYPLVSLAILFFLAAHIVESTVINLELYFEHRNYQATVFMFLPLSAAIVSLTAKLRCRIVLIIAIAVLLTLSALTYQRASLWSSSRALELYWAANSPSSARGRSIIASALTAAGRHDEAEHYLQSAMEQLPESALLTMTWMLQQVEKDLAEEKDFMYAGDRMARQPFDAQAVTGLRQLTQIIITKPDNRYINEMFALIELLETSSIYGSKPLFLRLVPYLKGKLLLEAGSPNAAYACYRDAMSLYKDTDASMMMVAEMAEHPVLALALLEQAKGVLEGQSNASLKRSRRVYSFEIDRVEKALLDDWGLMASTTNPIVNLENLRCLN